MVKIVKDEKLMDEGEYPLELTDLEQKDMTYGKADVYVFRVTSGAHKDIIVKGMATARQDLTPRCKQFLWIKALLGRLPGEGEDVDTKELIGKCCDGYVVQAETKSGTFNRVIRLMPRK